jgi:hypothetical protein
MKARLLAAALVEDLVLRNVVLEPEMQGSREERP